MKNKEIIIVKKKVSPVKVIFKTVTAVAMFACGALIAYKYIKDKLSSGILGKLDLDGDGEEETLILDTTGDGEIDTIIINSEHSDEE